MKEVGSLEVYRMPDVNPGLELLWFPQLLPLALVLEAKVQVPVRPGATGEQLKQVL